MCIYNNKYYQDHRMQGSLQSASTWANWIIKEDRLKEINSLKQEIVIKRVKKALKVKYGVAEEQKRMS